MKLAPTCGLVNSIKLDLAGLPMGSSMQGIHSFEGDIAKTVRRLGGWVSMLP
jgi:hypothetical protein